MQFFRSYRWLVFIAIVIVGYYFVFSPETHPSFFLKCPLYQFTGYQCPGCGSQRAFHALLHFNFQEAFRQNILFVLGIPYVGVLFFTSFNKEKYQKTRQFLLSSWMILAIIILALFFGVLRNF